MVLATIGTPKLIFGHGGQCPCCAARAGFHLCTLVVVCGHGMCMAGLLVDNSGSTRLVLLVTKHLTRCVLCSRRQAQDARHHGRYGREG